MVSKPDVPHDFPHSCKASRTWVRTSDVQFKIICSFCKKPIGWWNWTFATEETKVYPSDIDAKFDSELKKNWK